MWRNVLEAPNYLFPSHARNIQWETIPKDPFSHRYPLNKEQSISFWDIRIRNLLNKVSALIISFLYKLMFTVSFSIWLICCSRSKSKLSIKSRYRHLAFAGFRIDMFGNVFSHCDVNNQCWYLSSQPPWIDQITSHRDF